MVKWIAVVLLELARKPGVLAGDKALTSAKLCKKFGIELFVEKRGDFWPLASTMLNAHLPNTDRAYKQRIFLRFQ